MTSDEDMVDLSTLNEDDLFIDDDLLDPDVVANLDEDSVAVYAELCSAKATGPVSIYVSEDEEDPESD